MCPGIGLMGMLRALTFTLKSFKSSVSFEQRSDKIKFNRSSVLGTDFREHR